jgi:DNA-binding CsgD family transcriptional regulator
MTVRAGSRAPAQDALAERLERRVSEVIERARRALGRPAGTAADPAVAEADHETVGALLAGVQALLAGEDPSGAWRELTDAHDRDLEPLRDRYETRFEALSEVRDTAAGLERQTSPSAMLAGAPRLVCESSRLRRCVLSVVRDGFVVAEAVHFEADSAGALKALHALRASPARLEHPLIDAEIIRRRRATTVTGARAHPGVHRPMTEALGWHSYVAAPVVVAGTVFGILHADHGPEGPAPDVLDRDVLWVFVTGLAGAYESATLHRALRREREQLRQFLEWLSARSSELADAAIEFSAEPGDPPRPPGKLEVPVSDVADDRSAFEQVLTRRELEVLRLLADGESNKGIAAQLVLSEATVKFHVVNLLRKLHAHNRAEAVARYHRVLRASVPDQ